MTQVTQATRGDISPMNQEAREVTCSSAHSRAVGFSVSKEALLLLLFMLVGLVYRLDFLYAIQLRLDADEAIVGLMAKHILEGKGVPAFYYGQHYMGSLEALAVAGAMTVLGKTAAAVKVVPLICSLIMVPMIFSLVRLVANARAALFAAALVAFPPSGLVVWGLKTRGGFIELVLIGMLALYCTVRALQNSSEDLRGGETTPSKWPVLLAGLACGVGWWVNNQILYFMLPIGLFLLLQGARVEKGVKTLAVWFILGIVGFVVGSGWYWIYNLQNDFVSLEMFTSSSSKGTTWLYLGNFFSEALPILLGGRRFWTPTDVFPGATLAAFILYGTLWGVWLISRRSAWYRLIGGLKVDSHAPQELFFFFSFAVIAVFAGSSFGHLSLAPRYLLPLYVALFAVAGIGLDKVASWSRKVAAAILIAMILLHAASMYAGGRYVPGEPVVAAGQRVQRDHSALLRFLQDRGETWIRTDYWIGNRLAFESGEQLKALPFGDHRECRVPEYCEQLLRGGENSLFPIVLVPAQVAKVARGLTLQGITYQQAVIDGYVVLFDLASQVQESPQVAPGEFSIQTTSNAAVVERMIDGDISTRWGSGSPQNPDMKVTFKFDRPHVVSGIEYLLGSFSSDFPRGLRVTAVTAQGESLVVLRGREFKQLSYLAKSDGGYVIAFPEVAITEFTLEQRGKDDFFDWSIAELKVRGQAESSVSHGNLNTTLSDGA